MDPDEAAQNRWLCELDVFFDKSRRSNGTQEFTPGTATRDTAPGIGSRTDPR
jgi:hypothetical protein